MVQISNILDHPYTLTKGLPQNPGNEREHTPIQIRILNDLRELEQLEQLNTI